MTCPICNDTRWKTIDAEGVETVVRCDCWRETLVERAMKAAGIPPGYRHCALTNFEDRGANSLREALKATIGFAERFPVVDKGLFFLGRPGVGKTHLAIAALKEVIQSKGARGYFYKTAELLQQIRNTYNKSVDETEMEILSPVFDADLLVLDDVGVERPTEWVQETLAVLIDKRYTNRKSTILTANLNDEMDGKDYVDSVQFRLGPRTRSRLLEMCRWIFIESYDTREVGIHPSEKSVGQWIDRAKRLEGTIEKSRGMAKARLRAPSGYCRPQVDRWQSWVVR